MRREEAGSRERWRGDRPGDRAGFISIDSDLSSDQWQQLDKLLRKFPSYPQLLAEARSSLKEEAGLDYESDIKPALGDEIDVVWLDFAAGGTNVVALTKPDDPDALKRMIEKGNEKGPDTLVFEEQDGWFVLSDTQEKLDRFQEQAAVRREAGRRRGLQGRPRRAPRRRARARVRAGEEHCRGPAGRRPRR